MRILHESFSGARIIRLLSVLEVLLHGGNTVGGWTAKQIHQAVLTTVGQKHGNAASARRVRLRRCYFRCACA
jgi:hypothetical protein